MKQLLLILIFISISFGSFASHIFGGAITWKCLTNGQYVFSMEVYRDCIGINYLEWNQVLNIVGNPLPSDSAGGPVISGINMKLDTSKMISSNNGNLSPTCDTSTGSQISCFANFSSGLKKQGAVQVFYFTSDPITLVGAIPSSGWKFYWEGPCCRPSFYDIANVNSTGPFLMRAIMFPSLGGQTTSTCNNNSPKFTSTPLVVANRFSTSSFNESAFDLDGDSLVYSWDRPIDRPIANPVQLDYKPGYSPISPFPGVGHDPRNNSGILNQETGLLDFGVYSDVGYRNYIILIRVDAYRNGVLNASIFREIPTGVIDPPLLPNSSQNLPAKYKLGGRDTNQIDITVAAGQLLELPISITDTNLSGSQLLTMTMNGSHFSQDFTSTRACQNFSNSNCAYLDNSVLLPDTVLGVPSYKIEGVGQINTTFKWQTDCSLLGPNGRDKTYYFYFDAHDNFCPVPASRAAVIAVTVTNSETTVRPKLECVKSSILGTDVYWNQTVYNSINSFQSLEIYKASSRNGVYSQLTTITDTTTIGFRDLATTSSGFYYLKINGTSCNIQPQSVYSDTLTDHDNKLTVTNIPSCFKMSWNTQKRSYQTKYLIYREYPVGSGYRLIDSVYNTSEYCDPLTACNDSVNYYVRMENGGNCSYNFSTQKIIGNNALMNNGIREINHVLSANVSYGRFQWYDCNSKSIISDSINQSFAPQDTGNYAVILYQYGCVDTSNCVLYFPVGLAENNFQNQVSFFPNPTTGLINIKLGNAVQSGFVQVRNIQGQIIQKQRFDNQSNLELEIEGKAGIYFVQLTNQKGERANLKVVKQ